MSVRIVRYGQSDWEVDIRWRSHGGRRQRDRKVLRGTSKSAAHRWGQARERDLLINGPTVKSKEVPTLEAFASRFIEDYAVANRQKPSGIAAKRTILNQHLLPALGGRKLDAITDADVQRLKGQLTHLQPKTVSNILSVLKKLLDMGVEWGVISTPPCRVRLVKFAVAECASYDFREFDDLVKAAGAIDGVTLALVLLGGEAGLRCGEMMALEWTDVNFTARKLCVQRSEWKGEVTTPKGGRLRYVDISERLMTALKAIRNLKSRRVVCTNAGQPLTQQMVRRRVIAAATRAGLAKKGVHILRHTFCSHLAMLGVPAITIQRLAGHQNLLTTQRYMHVSPAASGQAIHALDQRVAGARGGIGETA